MTSAATTVTVFFVCVFGIAFGLEKDYFTAAVFQIVNEHDKENYRPLSQVKNANLAMYEKATKVAAEHGADIILFPGCGPSQFLVPGIETGVKGRLGNPCEEKQIYEGHPVLLALSCMAKKHNINMFVNQVGVKLCAINTCDANAIESCNEQACKDEIDYTGIAFGRNGKLLFGHASHFPYDTMLNSSKAPFEVMHVSDFGTVEMTICFDSACEVNGGNYGTETVLYTTFWNDKILPLKATGWQQSWILGNKFHLLSANCRLPSMLTLGSGIYAKKHGVLLHTYNHDGKSRLLMAHLSRSGSHVDGKARTFIISQTGVFEET